MSGRVPDRVTVVTGAACRQGAGEVRLPHRDGQSTTLTESEDA